MLCFAHNSNSLQIVMNFSKNVKKKLQIQRNAEENSKKHHTVMNDHDS